MTLTTQQVTAQDAQYLRRALELAEQGRGRTSPNPLVGCIVVREGVVLGEGWHERAGGAHAEVRALQQAGDARGATVYVTMEPCAHQGRTPPCSEALIAAGVSRVVFAANDPNPLAAGGAARLQEAGIAVLSGVLQDEAERQNEAFFTVQRRQRPLVLYKTAMTLDGKIATRTGQSRWITGAAARERVQQWRDQFDAVAVGINTVLLDDPLLTCRLAGGRSPLKVIFDSVARTPPAAKLFLPDQHGVAARVIIYSTEQAPANRVEALRAVGAEVIALPEQRGRSAVRAALADLRQRGVNSVLLEGGGTLAWSFFEAQAVDKIAFFIGPKLLGGAGASPLAGLGVAQMDEAITLADLQTEFIANDLLLTGQVRIPLPSQRRER
ncbi:MAG: bifunctional diaminohydroxyphosphoribosylaminopyrimidine deaminase/5-amino-6-(5-phosphoribosylamino)uracil reductase RibD [Truepera sp.]|nr:bifunctional diaminohydroxyphosphoribosylaminopyrimidine deaminase/5-amino-6-(5-phosphoribosylamino)uracil reductase RibD [Truepera sp.]